MDSQAEIREEPGEYRTEFDADLKRIALSVESAVSRHQSVIDWQKHLEVQREMRRDIKRELRAAGSFTDARLEDLAGQVVKLARRRAAQ